MPSSGGSGWLLGLTAVLGAVQSGVAEAAIWASIRFGQLDLVRHGPVPHAAVDLDTQVGTDEASWIRWRLRSGHLGF
jgi:hypothetical protein